MDGLFGVTYIPGWNSKYNGKYTGAWKVSPKNGVRPIAVIDGLSHTMAVSEVRFINSQTEGRGTWSLNMPGAGFYMAKTRPNAGGSNTTDDAYDTVPFCDPATAAGDPMHCTQNQYNGNTFAAARSCHTGGVNVVMADGAVGFVSDSVDIGIWQALATIANGDIGQRPF